MVKSGVISLSVFFMAEWFYEAKSGESGEKWLKVWKSGEKWRKVAKSVEKWEKLVKSA